MIAKEATDESENVVDEEMAATEKLVADAASRIEVRNQFVEYKCIFYLAVFFCLIVGFFYQKGERFCVGVHCVSYLNP